MNTSHKLLRTTLVLSLCLTPTPFHGMLRTLSPNRTICSWLRGGMSAVRAVRMGARNEKCHVDCDQVIKRQGRLIVAIDGPVAAGKSTAAPLLACRLGCLYVCSGFLWRALTYVLIKEYGYDEERLRDPKEHDVVAVLDPENLVYQYDGKARVLYKGEDITLVLKKNEIDVPLAMLFSNEKMRALLRDAQRRLAETQDLVIEGRDTASFIFPDAPFKFFLTASVGVRALRWRQRQGEDELSLEQAMQYVNDRDAREMRFASSPLQQTTQIIDSTWLTVDEVVDRMLETICRRK